MSSTLQIGLAVAGGVVLAAVVAHGAWSSRRNAPKRADPEPVEPSVAQQGVETERREPGFDEGLSAMPLPTPERRPGLDSLVDVIAPVAVDTPVSGDAALAAMPTTTVAGYCERWTT